MERWWRMKRWGTWHQRVDLLVQMPHPAFNPTPFLKVLGKHRCHTVGADPS